MQCTKANRRHNVTVMSAYVNEIASDLSAGAVANVSHMYKRFPSACFQKFLKVLTWDDEAERRHTPMTHGG